MTEVCHINNNNEPLFYPMDKDQNKEQMLALLSLNGSSSQDVQVIQVGSVDTRYSRQCKIEVRNLQARARSKELNVFRYPLGMGRSGVQT